MSQSYRTLVVDDDERIRKLIRVNLEPRGFIVQEAPNGSAAIEAVESHVPDLMLLDLVMPGLTGIDVCSWVRERSDVPIIVLSAKNEEDLKVQALDAGADDYIPKPFGYEELMARVRAVMRRAVKEQTPDTRIMLGELVIDLKARRVFISDEDVHLTRTEFALLAELGQHLGEIVTHEELLARVWGPEYFDASHYLHVYFGRIRNKIGPVNSEMLETVPGIGYSLHPPA